MYTFFHCKILWEHLKRFIQLGTPNMGENVIDFFKKNLQKENLDQFNTNMNYKNIIFSTNDWYNPFKNVKNILETDLWDIFSSGSITRINGLP